MKRRITAVLIALSLVLTIMPMSVSAANPSVNDKAVCYTPASDYRSGDCILTASKVMIRRASLLRGSKIWSTVSNKTLRNSATIRGLLLHKFTFNVDGIAYTVQVGFFKGKTDAARIKEFETLSKAHPEGVVVWGTNASRFGMHGVLLTGVKNGVPYAMDSYYNTGTRKYGIQRWNETSMKVPSKCTQYWYIKTVGLAKGAKAPAKGQPLKPISATNPNTASTMTIVDQSVPTEITQGNGFPVLGQVLTNYRLSNVTVSVLNSAGKSVIGKSANPNAWSFDLLTIDSAIKFGSLSPGTYTYRVTAKDEKKSATLVNAKFKVISRAEAAARAKALQAKTSTLKISSYRAPSSIKQGKPFSIKGKIKSNKTISKVSVQVLDSKGKVKLSASAKPKAKSYQIKKLDTKIKFGKLARGTYSYKVVATDSAKTKTLINKKFTVK